MLLNLTNHPSKKWSIQQTDAALKEWENIVDYPFPYVSPQDDEKELFQKACSIADDVKSLCPDAVLCQGEMTMTFILVQILQKKGIPVYAATSERISVESLNSDGSVEKKSVFKFIRFRRYMEIEN